MKKQYTNMWRSKLNKKDQRRIGWKIAWAHIKDAWTLFISQGECETDYLYLYIFGEYDKDVEKALLRKRTVR